MTQAILYFALGALSVSLVLFVVLPVISRRARRLAQAALERRPPPAFAEIMAEKDQIHARLAVERSRQAQHIEKLEARIQDLLIKAERRRVHAERIELEFDGLNDEFNALKKRAARQEREMQKHQEAAQSAAKALESEVKKARLGLEKQVKDLQAQKEEAESKMAALRQQVEQTQARLGEAQSAALQELSLQQELKSLAQTIHTFVKQSAPMQPSPPVEDKPELKPDQPKAAANAARKRVQTKNRTPAAAPQAKAGEAPSNIKPARIAFKTAPKTLRSKKAAPAARKPRPIKAAARKSPAPAHPAKAKGPEQAQAQETPPKSV